jgi:hypothetical protein
LQYGAIFEKNAIFEPFKKIRLCALLSAQKRKRKKSPEGRRKSALGDKSFLVRAKDRGQLSENFLSTQSVLSVPTRFIMTHLLTSFLTVPDFIAYAYRHRNLPALKLSKAIWGAREISWTIRDESTMKALEKEGCIPIFENFIP